MQVHFPVFSSIITPFAQTLISRGIEIQDIIDKKIENEDDERHLLVSDLKVLFIFSVRDATV